MNAFSISAVPPTDGNLLEAIKLPVEKQNWKEKDAAQKLAKSLVPPLEEARMLAVAAFLKKPGFDDREREHVAGLYFLGRDISGFADAGDLFWEVSVLRNDGISGVIWVSTTTKAVRILFPSI